MSLRYALLGLLADEPQSGYDLTQRFEQSLKRYAWHARHSQIYPELNKLAADGLISVVEEGARGRRTYALTEAGREALHDWLMDWSSLQPVRNEFVLRLFLMSVLDPAEALPVLRGIREHAEEEVAELKSRVEAASGPDGQWGFGRLAGEYGVRQYQAMVDWAKWAESELARAVPDEDSAGTST
ncbi:PadR family transcriptional regulator [Saccharopolyspora erythraea]|uniref:PadR family transcriptional regulator n=1 Tax=Saccharopolyspora erythraea TaxID=1836 RepID=UPI001BA9B107|nr:PadR family transcriptional regulator [Saccharopolyspora erythraea]QUG99544.1 PadR family transcriptional regulator [Saccharopolyspora erythraea]